MRLTITLALCVLGAALHGCATPPRSDATAESRAQLFPGMGKHRRPITTASPEAQRYFDQGLTWAYAFNHDEAIRSFTRAAELDPQCAMAWWGVALCHGPHINNPAMPEARRTAAWEALEKARALAAGASPTELALIDALSKRYSTDLTGDRFALDQAYAAAMELVWKAHPADADIATLYAESLMDLQPWDLWTKDGKPKGRATEVIAALEHAMRLDPDHPGALHLYIHTMEASTQPQRAAAAADRLRRLVPAAGHLVHMPAHIDVRLGQWEQASACNERAIAADAAYRRLSPRQEFYRVYMAHNHHFLAYASMMEGRFEPALRAARDMVEGIPAEFLEHSAALVDPYSAIEYQVLLRFGKWDELLARPAPAKPLVVTTAMWRFARASALAAKGDVAGARREQAEFRKAAMAVPADGMMAINKAHDVLKVAEDVLAGEIAFRERRFDDAVKLLRRAAQQEDQLVYMEPPEWIQPSRHALGAVLLVAGRGAEAEAAYRQDLEHYPENGWALLGLTRALRLQGKTAEAEDADARFKRAWRRADTKIGASCLCAQ